jgi:hypothetical protein
MARQGLAGQLMALVEQGAVHAPELHFPDAQPALLLLSIPSTQRGWLVGVSQTDVSERHDFAPEQFPGLHTAMQALFWHNLPFPHCASLQHCWQTPLHRNRLPPHLRLHLVPSHAAVALLAEGQASQEVGPQEPTLLLSRHSFPQR